MRSSLSRVFIVSSLCGLGLVGVYARDKPSAGGDVPRIFEIASVAYRSLDNKLKNSETNRGGAESEGQKWSSDIRNYNVEIMEYSDRIFVTFSLRPVNGRHFEDGVIHYELNETTGEILEQSRW